MDWHFPAYLKGEADLWCVTVILVVTHLIFRLLEKTLSKNKHEDAIFRFALWWISRFSIVSAVFTFTILTVFYVWKATLPPIQEMENIPIIAPANTTTPTPGKPIPNAVPAKK